MKRSYPPLLSKSSKVLILGTMPSVESLAKKQFYAHPRNALWRILFDVFGAEFSEDYDRRKQLVRDNNIILYDVLESCEREGSLDSNIKNYRPNDVNGLIRKYPTIKRVLFNGKAAEKFYYEFFDPVAGVEYLSMPSTSPAYASKTYEQKMLQWKKVLNN
ncbi:hypoxanthine-DNA glycosylase [Parelusimicrobium proximum]|uniref:DNA-deoxyinosine glycosylase n=1 Tax=Parelusimicrobium proximum TaxID=3228953 RepID=UPI003D16980E